MQYLFRAVFGSPLLPTTSGIASLVFIGQRERFIAADHRAVENHFYVLFSGDNQHESQTDRSQHLFVLFTDAAMETNHLGSIQTE